MKTGYNSRRRNPALYFFYYFITFPLIFLFFLSCIIHSPKDESASLIPYPHPLPDSLPITFLPGVVSQDSTDFNAAFSPGGKSFYFTRSLNQKTKIYVTHFRNNHWTPAAPFSFTVSGYSEADPAFSPDGSLYFISDRPKNKMDSLRDYDIWRIIPLSDSLWSAPENMRGLNTDSSEYYISFSENGDLYFASSRAGGFGEEDIYMSRFANNRYGVPENVGSAINSKNSEYDPCISDKGDLLIFTSATREDSYGAADLYISKRTNDQWEQAQNLGGKFNTSTRDFCPYFSPDSRYFFFSSENNIKWVCATFVKMSNR